jgi:hypothetical protein
MSPRHRRFVTVAGLVTLASILSFAQDITPPVPERVTFHSTVLGEDRIVFVRVPPGYANSDAAYPVLYLTDGDVYVNEIGSVADFLAANDRMPGVIIVGTVQSDRFRDLTPTHADIKKRDGTIVFRVPTSGGADAFLKFLETELAPNIQKRYRTEPFRILVGHSLGGLFALHALISRPTIFQAYIAVSPSLEWDDEVVLRSAERFFASTKQLKATLLVSSSDEGGIVSRFDDDLQQLRRIFESHPLPGFTWDSLVMKDEDHNSGVLRAHYAGLRKIFSGWQMPRDSQTLPVGGLPGIEEHYRQLSEQFGYDISAERAINDLGYQLLAFNKADDALAAFKRNVQLYPNSANVYNSLADYYEAIGQVDAARQNVSKAIEIATSRSSPQLFEFKKHLELLKSVKPPQ